ncbi:hypothetical protein WMY93_000067 [Mugilogobius chulae]|uniref:P2X purinoreceptor 7 intracellular domain-containing protein n=1 Tax=Mugilogobius chulae TaxID=88201 RepID=A0AAW0Q400_9GOBI
MALPIVQPYAYDPPSDTELEFSQEPERVRRQLQDASAWCTCGNCHTMPTEAENVCCQEIPQVVRRINQMPTPPACITSHPGFQVNCLNIYALQNMNNIYRADYGPVRRRTEEERFRFVAYRSIVSWCWDYLVQEFEWSSHHVQSSGFGRSSQILMETMLGSGRLTMCHPWIKP